MPNTTQINFSVTDLSFSVSAILQGISFAEGITKRGPFADPEKLITSWDQFLKLYGGFVTSSDFPLLCRRAFDRGAQLRVSRVGHYTDITDASSLDAVKADINKVSVLTFDAALITANLFDVDVNGTGIASVLFATDSDTTMAAIATAIALDAKVAEAFVIIVGGPGSDDRVIIVVPNDSTVVTLTSAAVTLGASQAAVVVTQPVPPTFITRTNQALFTLRPKYEGADYNNLQVTIGAPSNGQTALGYFNLTISHLLESSLEESYANLKISGQPTAGDSDYLSDIEQSSQLMDVTYYDLSSFVGQINPREQVYNYILGSDGSAVVAGDYIGDSSGKNGLHAFNTVDDGLQVAIPEISTTSINIAGAAYAAARKDINFYAHFSNGIKTADGLITERDSTLIDTRFAAIFAGGVKILHPVTNLETSISEMGDILGIMAFNDTSAAEWFSPAGTTRGGIPNSLGVVNNFGMPALFNDLNNLSNHQINMVIVRNNTVYLVDANTAQLANSKLSYLNTQRFLLFLQKSLDPTLQGFMDEPLDVPLFGQIFRAVEPFLNSLVTDRALYAYSWQGDQDVSTIDDIVINDPTDLDNGKYKVRLFLKIIPSLKELGIELVVTPTGTQFDIL